MPAENIVLADAIGFVAGLLIVLAWLPQLFKTWKTKSAKDLSLLTLLIILAGSVLWLVYGIIIGNMPVIATNAVCVVIIVSLVWMKVNYGGHGNSA